MKYLMLKTLGYNLREGMIIDLPGPTISVLEEQHGPRETWLTRPNLRGVDDGLEEERTALFSAEE